MDEEESSRKKERYFRQKGSHVPNAKAGSLVSGGLYRGLHGGVVAAGVFDGNILKKRLFCREMLA